MEGEGAALAWDQGQASAAEEMGIWGSRSSGENTAVAAGTGVSEVTRFLWPLTLLVWGTAALLSSPVTRLSCLYSSAGVQTPLLTRRGTFLEALPV